MRLRTSGCRRLSSQNTGRGGGPLAPLGAPTGLGALYRRPLISASSMWSRSAPYSRVASANPRTMLFGNTVLMNFDIGLVAWVRSSSHEPGDGGTNGGSAGLVMGPTL